MADKSFDNTGCKPVLFETPSNVYKCANPCSIVVLLEAPFDNSRKQRNSVLLAIDLTTAVANEAIEKKCSVVVAYRMPHYSSLKISAPSTNTFQQTRLSSAASNPSPSPTPSKSPSSAWHNMASASTLHTQQLTPSPVEWRIGCAT